MTQHTLMAQLVELQEENARLREDAERLDFLELQTHRSSTGVSLDWCKSVEDGLVKERGYRVSWRKHLGDRRLSIRAAIDAAMQGKEASNG